ncbi:hypothetical protein ETB97_001526 [Aspergillus alliaceus]|uniref:Uncharacterized protein n=1 Tax=Petromyces alliaceus TaxID=209559 RepID=A0A8H6ECI2_PETAA|nr:hypothetical protein ETB97_001526 [Aspergillus burnettii]
MKSALEVQPKTKKILTIRDKATTAIVDLMGITLLDTNLGEMQGNRTFYSSLVESRRIARRTRILGLQNKEISETSATTARYTIESNLFTVDKVIERIVTFISAASKPIAGSFQWATFQLCQQLDVQNLGWKGPSSKCSGCLSALGWIGCNRHVSRFGVPVKPGKSDLSHADATQAKPVGLLGSWIWRHDPERYATEKYHKALDHLVKDTLFQSTNIPPGHVYKHWTIEELLNTKDVVLEGNWE